MRLRICHVGNWNEGKGKVRKMKCDRCFFCTHIGKGVQTDYPMKYCKHFKEYKLPFVCVHDERGTRVTRQLDLSKMSDCKLWRDVGCNIHPSTVAKARREFIESLEGDADEQI